MRHDSDLCGGPSADQHAIVDHHHPLDNFGDRADGMVDQHDRHARGSAGAQNFYQLCTSDGSRPGERLVEQQQGRSRDQSAGDFEQPDLRRSGESAGLVGELRQLDGMQRGPTPPLRAPLRIAVRR